MLLEKFYGSVKSNVQVRTQVKYENVKNRQKMLIFREMHIVTKDNDSQRDKLKIT